MFILFCLFLVKKIKGDDNNDDYDYDEKINFFIIHKAQFFVLFCLHFAFFIVSYFIIFPIVNSLIHTNHSFIHLVAFFSKIYS